MTLQEIFDKAYLGLASQNFKRSRIDSSEVFPGDTVFAGCRYRGPDGLKCAVGHLISDECYLASFEGRNADDLAIVQALRGSGAFSDAMFESGFLTELQSAHDRGCTAGEMRTLLDTFAQRHGLTIPPISP